MARRPLKGSERSPLPNSRALGPADPAERLEVTVVVRATDRRACRLACRESPSGQGSRNHLSRADYARRHGASRADLDAVREFRRGARAGGRAGARRAQDVGVGRHGRAIQRCIRRRAATLLPSWRHLSWADRPRSRPRRVERHHRGGPRPRQPSAGRGALSDEDDPGRAALATGSRGSGFLHSRAARRDL